MSNVQLYIPGGRLQPYGGAEEQGTSAWVWLLISLGSVVAVIGLILGTSALYQIAHLPAIPKYPHGPAVAQATSVVESWLATPLYGGSATYNFTVVSVGSQKTLYMTALDTFTIPSPPGDLIVFGPGSVPAAHLPFSLTIFPIAKLDGNVIVELLDVYHVVETQVYLFVDGSVLVAPKYWDSLLGQAQTLAGNLFAPAVNGKAFYMGMQPLVYSNASGSGPTPSNVLFFSAKRALTGPNVTTSAEAMRLAALSVSVPTPTPTPPPPAAPAAQVEIDGIPAVLVCPIGAPMVDIVIVSVNTSKVMYISSASSILMTSCFGSRWFYFNANTIPPHHRPAFNTRYQYQSFAYGIAYGSYMIDARLWMFNDGSMYIYQNVPSLYWWAPSMVVANDFDAGLVGEFVDLGAIPIVYSNYTDGAVLVTNNEAPYWANASFIAEMGSMALAHHALSHGGALVNATQ